MKTSQRKRIEIIIGEAVLIFFAFLFLLPILWMFCTSLKSSGQIAEYKQLFPNPATVRSYIEGFAGGQFGLYIRNTVFIGVMCVIGTVSSCSGSFLRGCPMSLRRQEGSTAAAGLGSLCESIFPIQSRRFWW